MQTNNHIKALDGLMYILLGCTSSEYMDKFIEISNKTDEELLKTIDSSIENEDKLTRIMCIQEELNRMTDERS